MMLTSLRFAYDISPVTYIIIIDIICKWNLGRMFIFLKNIHKKCFAENDRKMIWSNEGKSSDRFRVLACRRIAWYDSAKCIGCLRLSVSICYWQVEMPDSVQILLFHKSCKRLGKNALSLFCESARRDSMQDFRSLRDSADISSEVFKELTEYPGSACRFMWRTSSEHLLQEEEKWLINQRSRQQNMNPVP